jgi:predicted transcriptional regulator
MNGDGESVGEAAQRVYGCLPQNSAEDVLDMMDALQVKFMPLVADFESGKVLGIIGREDLSGLVDRGGGSARAGDAGLIALPTIRADTPLSAIAETGEPDQAWLVVDALGQLHGIYQSQRPEQEVTWQE